MPSENFPEQRSDEWFAVRLGKLTASSCKDALATTKTGESKLRSNLKLKILSERLTGMPVKTPLTIPMQEGIDNELSAKLAFEEKTGLQIKECFFFDHPSIPMLGASPDGIVGDALIEIKCPQQVKHTETILSGQIPKEHFPQLLCQLACAEKKKIYFVSYHPFFPENSQLFIKEFEPSREEIEEFEKKALAFLNELNKMEGVFHGS